MKILAISCSPRKNGNTVAMLEEVLHGARGKNAETELFSVSGKNLQPCDGCWTCTSSGECHINDDMKDLHDRMVEADGIVFGTPVYFYGMTAQAKNHPRPLNAFRTPGQKSYQQSRRGCRELRQSRTRRCFKRSQLLYHPEKNDSGEPGICLYCISG